MFYVGNYKVQLEVKVESKRKIIITIPTKLEVFTIRIFLGQILKKKLSSKRFKIHNTLTIRKAFCVFNSPSIILILC